jgi:hypothetical protein
VLLNVRIARNSRSKRSHPTLPSDGLLTGLCPPGAVYTRATEMHSLSEGQYRMQLSLEGERKRIAVVVRIIPA